MQSCAWTNRQCRQVGPSSQYSQAATEFTYNTARNLQAAAANATCQNRTANTGVGPPKKANLTTFHYGVYSNRQPSNRQTAGVPHQAVSAGRNDYYQRVSLTDTVQHSSTNAQSGYPTLPVTHGFQQDFRQNSAQDSTTQSPPSMMAPNIAYPQQVKSAHWNQSVRVHREQSVRVQADTIACNYQHCRDQNSLFHNFNGESTRPVSACTTTTTSPACEEVVYTAAAYNRQTAHNHSSRLNSTQHGSLPSCHVAISPAIRNNITAKSSGQNLHFSSTSPKTQQYPTHKNSSINSNSRQYYTSLLLSKTNVKNKIPLKPAVNPQQEMQKMIARLEDYLREPSTAGSDGRPPAYASSPYGRKQFVSKGRMMESNQNVQPVASTVTEMYSLNSSQSLSLNSGQSLPKTTHSVMSTQQSVDVPPQQNSGPNVSATSLSNPEELLISPKSKPVGPGVEPYPHLENPNQMRSDASNDGVFVSDSVGPQYFSQKQLCADDTGSQHVIDKQVDQLVASTAQQSVTSKVLVSQSNDEDKSEMPTDSKEIFDLSSVPTTPWTHGALTKLVQDGEKAQMELTDMEFDFLNKGVSMFWDREIKDLKTQWNKDYLLNILQAKKFCREHETPDSVILSQVKRGFEKRLESYHVLKDNEVYSELPYKSSWLNINQQLDDIDKEFDIPQTLKHNFYTLESNSQPDQFETDSGIPAQILNEVSNKMLSSTELEPVESSEEKQNPTVESTSTQMTSPNKTESTNFGDSYSFKIQVLPPEEARVIFEQVHSKLPKSMDTDNQPERHTNSSAEGDLVRDIDATSSDTKLKNDLVCPVEEFCCIALMKEIIWGSDTVSVSKCQCKYKQSHKNDTDKTLVQEEIAEEKKDKLCVVRSDSNFFSATEKNDLCYIIDLTEYDDKPPLYSIKELHSSSQMSTSCNLSSIILSSESEIHNQIPHFENDSEGAQVKLTERSPSSASDGKYISKSDTEVQSDPEVDFGQDKLKSTGNTPLCCDEEIENLSSSESEIHNQIPDFENDSEGAQLKLTESSPSSGSDGKYISRSDTEIQSDPEVDCGQDQLKSTGNTPLCYGETENLSSSESDVASQMSDSEENYEAAPLMSTTEVESSEEEQTETSAMGAQQTARSSKQETVERKRKRLSSHDTFFPVFKKSNKFNSLVDVDSQPVHEDASKCGKGFDEATGREPSASDVQTVKLSLFGSSAKNKCILSGSRKSHISSRAPEVLTVNLMKRKRRKTITTWNYSVKQLYKKWKISFPPSKISPANTDLPVSSEMTWNGKATPCLRLKRKWSLTDEEEESERDTVTLNQHADEENGSHAVMPSQNNDVLKFCVLPHSFNFKDGSNGREETSDPLPDKPDLVEGKDKTPSVIKARGTWCSIPKTFFSPPISTTQSLFREFQKKYKETPKLSINE